MSNPFVDRLFAGIPEEIAKLGPLFARVREFNARVAAERVVEARSRVVPAQAAVELAAFELEVARGVAALDLDEIKEDLSDEG